MYFYQQALQVAVKPSPNPRKSGYRSVVFLLIAASLAGCGSRELTTGSIGNDYRLRHPIVLAEAEQSLLIPVSPNDQRLTTGMKDTVRGFASRFGESAAGMMQIQVPSASHNSRAAELLAKQIRTTLSHSGIPADRIHLSHYRAGGEGDAAPIRLVYVATRAMTGPCGQWPEDLSNDTLFNENWHNFGCASQNNLAAQIANPTDLLGPRAMTPIDASQRAAVIESYRAASDD